ncbi:L,D-transpeptidase [Streptomyces sp. NPDC032472]|uniref:L,D-transpeptidase n=1 Tax=Streptomyces sp. NPDC032472 TaxID=3155018 RepID=UPI0033E18371
MNITTSSRLARSAAAALAAASIGLLAGLAPGAQAEEAAAVVAGSAPQDGAVRLKFDKNRKDPSDSRLYVIKGRSVLAEFRAGSGTTTNDCETGRGWLPNGTYTVGQHHETYNGRLIKGYAIRLSDKKCNDGAGRVRNELFIHSEMNRDGSQGSTEKRRWTDSNPNDFRSNGCIKMRPEEIKKMFRLLERNGWPKTLSVVS